MIENKSSDKEYSDKEYNDTMKRILVEFRENLPKIIHGHDPAALDYTTKPTGDPTFVGWLVKKIESLLRRAS